MLSGKTEITIEILTRCFQLLVGISITSTTSKVLGTVSEKQTNFFMKLITKGLHVAFSTRKSNRSCGDHT